MILRELLQLREEATEWDSYPILKLLYDECGAYFLKFMLAYEDADSLDDVDDELRDDMVEVIVNDLAEKDDHDDPSQLEELQEKAEKLLKKALRAYKNG